jgi:hypothetical protein
MSRGVEFDKSKPYIIRYLYAEVKPYADNKSLENKDKMPIIAGLM